MSPIVFWIILQPQGGLSTFSILEGLTGLSRVAHRAWGVDPVVRVLIHQDQDPSCDLRIPVDAGG